MIMILRLIQYFISLIYWQRQPVEKIKDMQLKKFKEVFEFAREKSPFYRELYTKAGVMDLDIKTWDDVEKIPIVDKELLKKHGIDRMATTQLNASGIVRCSTSGSTGEPFQLAYSTFANLSAYIRVLYIMWKTVGYTPFKKMVLLSKYEKDESFKVEKNVSILNKVQKTLGLFSREIISVYEDREVIAGKLIAVKPDILYSSSSAVEIVANYLLETNQSIHIPSIVLIAEPLSKSQYQKFSDVFGAKVVDIYGAKESPSIGYEVNKEGCFRLFPNSNFTEFLDIHKTADGNKGTIVVTNLINKIQPFIRYNLKDYADIIQREGFGTKFIGPIVGRLSDILTFPDGNKLFHYGISQRFIDFHLAAQYKFMQVDDGPIIMQILPKTGVEEYKVIEEARSRWNQSYSQYELSIEIVDKFEIDKKTGKFKVIDHIVTKQSKR